MEEVARYREKPQEVQGSPAKLNECWDNLGRREVVRIEMGRLELGRMKLGRRELVRKEMGRLEHYGPE